MSSIEQRYTFIEKHLDLSLLAYEGLWRLIFMNPHKENDALTVYLKTPSADYKPEDYKDGQIVNIGPRLEEVLLFLEKQIEFYPYTWDLANQKIAKYGYDFESDLKGNVISRIDLTEIAYKVVQEHYNLFSPITGEDVIEEDEYVSGKGVMTKLKITLDKPKLLNHLAIDFFTEYPMEILSFMYQLEEGDTQPTYELSLTNVVQSISSLHLHFTPIQAKVFYLILKQETYTLLNESTNQETYLRKREWENASENSKSIYMQQAEAYLSDAAITIGEELVSQLYHIPIGFNQEKAPEITGDNYRTPFLNIKKQLDQQ